MNLDALNKKNRDEKFHGARSEFELKKQLAEIERAAKDAIAVDREEQGDLFFQPVRHPAPPPPSRRDGGGKAAKGGDQADNDEDLRENK